jgi:hypothetical protein
MSWSPAEWRQTVTGNDRGSPAGSAVVVERLPVSRAELRTRLWAMPTRLVRAHGHVVLALTGALVFLFAHPAVPDLQAANARAAAAARGVGLTYWLSWFAGSSPGSYSVLTPPLTAVIGVTVTGAIGVMVVAVFCGPLLAGTLRPRSAAYLAVLSALCNLYSGRVPFGLGVAFAVVALVLLRRGRPWLGGVLIALAALASPLASAFALLGLIGFFVAQPARRGAILRFTLLAVVGLVLPAIAFGAPGAMPFGATTLGWTVGILAAAAFLRLPRPVRVGLYAAILVSILLYVFPNGLGANIGRYAYLVLPPVIWALAPNRRRIVVIALIPALVYSGFNVVGDLAKGSDISAQTDYYRGLAQELATLPDLHNHRVEVIDTATHGGASELVPQVYLARGWENQSDTADDPIFYRPGALNASSYRDWLDDTSTAWIAVPSDPNRQYANEAQLVTGGLSYADEIWADASWRLYAVHDPVPIVSAPAQVISADETHIVFDVKAPATITLHVRPSKYLQLTSLPSSKAGAPTTTCLTEQSDSSVQAAIAAPGRYQLDGAFSVQKMFGDPQC